MSNFQLTQRWNYAKDFFNNNFTWINIPSDNYSKLEGENVEIESLDQSEEDIEAKLGKRLENDAKNAPFWISITYPILVVLDLIVQVWASYTLPEGILGTEILLEPFPYYPLYFYTVTLPLRTGLNGCHLLATMIYFLWYTLLGWKDMKAYEKTLYRCDRIGIDFVLCIP